MSANLALHEYLAPKPARRIPPDPAEVARAAGLIGAARRPLVVTGRGAQGAAAELVRFLDASGALYLDTQESRGLVPGAHPSFVGAVRARAMKEADLIIAIGRKLDYQMGYGSPAVFPNARWIRMADNADEIRENRRGEVELFADPALALAALAGALPKRNAVDSAWTTALRDEHLRRSAKYAEGLASAPPGNDGHMHPNRIFGALRAVLKPDAITIADGGDILSFARLGLEAPRTYLDSGTFGCLGVGTPYGVAAGLLHPERQVVVVSGDGAFGINAMEIDSAKRHGAKVVFIIANNAAWNIERLDQQMNYGGRVVGTTLAWSDYAAMARAFGLHAERVTDPARLKDALEEAFSKSPALLDVVVTQDALSSDAGKGLGLGPRLPGAHRLGRRREGTPLVRAVLNVGEIVAVHARLRPGKIGARDSRRALTFAQWNSRACRLANALLGLGLSKGDRVAVLAFNRVEWMEIYVALAKAGLVAVPVNFRLVAAGDPVHCGALRRASVHRRARSDRSRGGPSRRASDSPQAAISALAIRPAPAGRATRRFSRPLPMANPNRRSNRRIRGRSCTPRERRAGRKGPSAITRAAR